MNQLVRRYFRLWAKETFKGPWGITMGVAGILGLIVSATADRYPAWSGIANRAAWQVPLALFLLTLLPAAIHASYKLWAERMRQWAEVSDELHELKFERKERGRFQSIANVLTKEHHFAVHDLSGSAPNLANMNDKDWTYRFEEWHEQVKRWNAKVLNLMVILDCSEQERARFWTIDAVDGGMLTYGNRFEVLIRMHQTRVRRLWAIIESYEAKAEGR